MEAKRKLPRCASVRGVPRLHEGSLGLMVEVKREVQQ